MNCLARYIATIAHLLAGPLIFCAALPAVPAGGALAAEKQAAGASIAVFCVPEPGLQLKALSLKSTEQITDAFTRLGRFYPVEASRAEKTLEAQLELEGKNPYHQAAVQLRADVYAVVSVGSTGSMVYGRVTIVPLSGRYGAMNKSITVRSVIPMNVPLKLAREIALLHNDLPIEADIIEKRDGLHVLSAGQWQGLSDGRYSTAGGERVRVMTTSRFQCIALLPDSLKDAKYVTIKKYPPTRAIIKEIDDGIDFNINYKYGLASTQQVTDVEKKFILGLMVINLGANTCLPGYGSHMSTSYLGFKNALPSVPGIVASAALIITHFILPECMTKFKINFFPGVMDSDKTVRINNLQIFCWSTLPLTASVAFLDQLSYQCTKLSVLPPFFKNKNETAFMLSLFIPGGGMFYKGYRLPGWGFYLSEMFLAGFCVYTKDKPKYIKYAGIALGGVKCIELLASLLAKPSYKFYNLEKEGPIHSAALSINIEGDESGEPVYKLGMTFRY